MYVKSTYSTNTLLKELIAKGEWPTDEIYLRAGYQTAGRGQAGNSWESEADKNLLCSIVISHQHSAFSHQPFYLNVAVSVAMHRLVYTLSVNAVHGLYSIRPQAGLTIKWPNDIYWEDKKIAGILIENAIIGKEIKYSIAGIGLNVNQQEWHSDAPNPVSLRQITGREYEVDELMRALVRDIYKVLDEPASAVWDYYRAHLYRREGFWPFVEREVSTAPTMNADTAFSRQLSAISFMARIEDILPTGEIVLRDQQNQQRTYHFKQVRYVVN